MFLWKNKINISIIFFSYKKKKKKKKGALSGCMGMLTCVTLNINLPGPLLIVSQSDFWIQVSDTNSQLMANSQLSGSTLFANARNIPVQQDKG